MGWRESAALLRRQTRCGTVLFPVSGETEKAGMNCTALSAAGAPKARAPWGERREATLGGIIQAPRRVLSAPRRTLATGEQLELRAGFRLRVPFLGGLFRRGADRHRFGTGFLAWLLAEHDFVEPAHEQRRVRAMPRLVRQPVIGAFHQPVGQRVRADERLAVVDDD